MKASKNVATTQDWWTDLRLSNFRRNDGCSEADDRFDWSNPGKMMLEIWISLEIWKTETYNSKSRYFDFFPNRPDMKRCLSMIANDLVSGPRNVRSNGHEQRWPHKFPWICQNDAAVICLYIFKNWIFRIFVCCFWEYLHLWLYILPLVVDVYLFLRRLEVFHLHSDL